jgi:hypothetical protein
MLTGQCNCGGVKFEVSSETSPIFACHCSICGRYTGSGSIPVVIAPKLAFKWLRGENLITNWIKPDADWQSWFCSTCGSTLPGENDEAHMFIPAGSITEGDDKLTIAHHIWVGSKAPWDEIGDSGKQHNESYRA